MMHILIFPTLSSVCSSPLSMWTLSIKFQFFNSSPILGSALIIASLRHDMRCDNPSASLYGKPLRYTNLLIFLSTWMHSTYSCIFYIISLNKFSSIIICLPIFFIINLYNLLFWKNTTPIIINISLSVIRLYIFSYNFVPWYTKTPNQRPAQWKRA